MADPDAPAQSKRPRLDSGNPDRPLYNGHAFPPPPPPLHTQPTRPPSHPTLVQASPPPPSHHYSPHGLPPPSHPYPHHGQGYPGPLPSPSLPPSDIRALAARNIPSPRLPPTPGNGVNVGSPVTLSQDRTSRPPPAPQSTSAPEPANSRSTSLSISLDVKSQHSLPPMEHGGHQPHWSVPEHRPNGTIPSGYNHAISPSHTNGLPYQHQPPPPAGPPQYAQPVTPYGQSPYVADYGSAAQQQMRRKQVRATQACNHCRSRKQKCDEARPCQFCRENNFDCQYKDVPPPKQDRSMMQLQDSVNSISEVLQNFIGEFQGWKQEVDSRLPPGRGPEMLSNHASPRTAISAPPRDQGTAAWNPPMQGRGQVRRIQSSGMKMESPVAPHSAVMSPLGAQASTPIKQESFFPPPPQQPATPAESIRTDRSQATESGPKEKTGLQGDHTTPAHKLLDEWQQINIFVKDVGYLKRLVAHGREVSDYPMQLEQDRGLLRVWGVGEGQDLNDGAQGPGSPESGNDSESYSPAPGKDGLWGHPPFDHSSPATEPSSTPREIPVQVHQSGLTSDGRPDFRRHVLFELLQSYIDTMHRFHPFMNESKLRRMFKEFSDQYSPEGQSASVRSPAFPGMNQLNPGLKRKRSTSVMDNMGLRGVEIERSLRNAIVLLVLALGKACSYTKPLPAPQSDRSPYINSTWGYIRDSPNPTNGSFYSDTSDDSRPRNIDILPGMAYYAYATDILGNQQGGNTVAHAQAMLLAALYLSQYARVLESWSWINNACRIVLVLIKADYSNLLRINQHKTKQWTSKERYRLNLVMCVYWTALQLESDILAEMSSLPPSGVSEHQSEIMYPEGVNEENWGPDQGNMQEVSPRPIDQLVMKLYSTQIWLRVVLNAAHNALYGSKGGLGFDTTNVKEVAIHAHTHVRILENWRGMLSPELAWNDNEYPHTDLNIARVRAKYYGGLYMMLRPYLKLASHVLEFPPQTPTSQNHQIMDLNDDQRNIINIAKQCINSAIRSTIAFDRVGEEPGQTYSYFTPTRTKRLVVTNIFGTLHAQFGNMLVLTSVFKSKLYPLLQPDTWLTREALAALYRRTISVLEEVAPNSPILRMDLDILREVQSQMGFK